LVMWSAIPPGAFWPIVRARVTSTSATRCRAVWQARSIWDASCQAT
jgi:hypothetical protein